MLTVACMALVACSSQQPSSTPPPCKATLPDSSECATETPSYAKDVTPIVQGACLGCHYRGNPNSTQVLETQAELHASRSLVETELYRCQMPPQDGTPLTEADRTLLLRWLVCGAPDN